MQQYKKTNHIKHFPAIARFKAICGKINTYQIKLIGFLKRGKIAFLARFLRRNLARVGVLGCALSISFANINSQNGNILDGNFLFNRDGGSYLGSLGNVEKPHSLALASMTNTDELADYEKFLKEEGEKNTVLGSMKATANPTAEEFNSGQQDVFIYKVKEGDTVSSIAQKYSITTSTILWANDLNSESLIKPGDEIFILPTTGVKHKVKSGDTIKALAKKYEAKEDKIIEFNDLSADGELAVGEEIIIPDGKIEDEPRYQDALMARYTAANPDAQITGPTRSTGLNKYPAHRFPYGWCTWYVATKRHVPWGGNAGTWLYHAKAYGAKTGKSPIPGAIMVTHESRWGHVAYVEKVSGNKVTVSEMNYKGWGVKNTRTIDARSGIIKGYIY
ncbi:MAG: LysM peptidoglycan-binding domain-containing protein [Candidatus Moranbacteria bacterium]|nr:LysM peptidoglycan-binding domain-containing protein [Candidatus Moranbacteria bacterium]